MGCSTFSNFTVLPEIAVAKIREDAPFDTSCYIGCGVTTGVGAVVNTAKVQPGENIVVFGLGGIGLNVIQGAKLAGAGRIIGVDINPAREEWGRRFGMTHFLNSKGLSREETIAKILELTDGGADYSFDATGNTEVMRTALEACHRGWGTSIIIGVAEAGREISTRPFQLVTGRNSLRDRRRRAAVGLCRPAGHRPGRGSQAGGGAAEARPPDAEGHSRASEAERADLFQDRRLWSLRPRSRRRAIHLGKDRPGRPDQGVSPRIGGEDTGMAEPIWVNDRGRYRPRENLAAINHPNRFRHPCIPAPDPRRDERA